MKRPRSASNATRSSKKFTPFIEKTYAMLEAHNTNYLISWLPNGLSFVVTDSNHLAQDILPRYFNHGNFASFVRQLHFYGFHKTSLSSGGCEFKHEFFQRGRLDLLDRISRKSTDTITKQRSLIETLQSKVVLLEQQNERLVREQNRIISFVQMQQAHANNAAAVAARNSNARPQTGRQQRNHTTLTVPIDAASYPASSAFTSNNFDWQIAAPTTSSGALPLVNGGIMHVQIPNVNGLQFSNFRSVTQTPTPPVYSASTGMPTSSPFSPSANILEFNVQRSSPPLDWGVATQGQKERGATIA